MQLAPRPANERFPFGRASERYFWPFVVALLLFSVGGAFAIFDGIDAPPAPARRAATSRLWSYAVLGVSLAIEGMSFRVAWAEFRKLAAGRPLRRALLEARDPDHPARARRGHDRDGGPAPRARRRRPERAHRAGLLGSRSAASSSASCSAPSRSSLARITHGLLIGESATPEDQARVLELARSVDGVEGVTQLLTLHLGPDVVLLAMKIAFRPTLTRRARSRT